MATTIETVEYEQVAELLAEARAHGDDGTVAAAERALETEFGVNEGVHADDLAECVRVIAEAEAQS